MSVVIMGMCVSLLLWKERSPNVVKTPVVFPNVFVNQEHDILSLLQGASARAVNSVLQLLSICLSICLFSHWNLIICINLPADGAFPSMVLSGVAFLKWWWLYTEAFQEEEVAIQ
jgi:hypothetical protein